MGPNATFPIGPKGIDNILFPGRFGNFTLSFRQPTLSGQAKNVLRLGPQQGLPSRPHRRIGLESGLVLRL
jgi:hypothetical protein